MKNTFIEKMNKIDLDDFISNFMDYKESIGNGVGAGKAFEKFFCNQINNKMDDVYAIHLNLSNSLFIWDVIITDNSDAEKLKPQIISIIKSNSNIEQAITECLGDNWLGASLKTYKDDACQITTDYTYRTYLENKAPEIDLPEFHLDEFFNLLNKHDNSRYLIIALNTYDNVSVHNEEIQKLETKLESLRNFSKIENTKKEIQELKNKQVTNTYTFRLLEFQTPFDKVSYKKNSKLSQYDLSIRGENIFKVLYGKNQANAFQRGIWTHNKKSIEYFEMVKKGNYRESNFNHIIEQTIGMSTEQLNRVLEFIKQQKKDLEKI